MDQQGRVCSWVSQWVLPSTWEPFLQNRCCHGEQVRGCGQLHPRVPPSAPPVAHERN